MIEALVGVTVGAVLSEGLQQWRERTKRSRARRASMRLIRSELAMCLASFESARNDPEKLRLRVERGLISAEQGRIAKPVLAEVLTDWDDWLRVSFAYSTLETFCAVAGGGQDAAELEDLAQMAEDLIRDLGDLIFRSEPDGPPNYWNRLSDFLRPSV